MNANYCRRGLVVLLVGFVACTGPSMAPGQEKSERRYGIEIEADTFPQRTAKEALRSVVGALETRRVDYLLAQLADPAFVDQRVKVFGGNFRELVKETTDLLASDPTSSKVLRKFLIDGAWEEGDDAAVVKLKDVKNRSVFLKKIGERWYLENRQKAEEPKKDAGK